MIRLGRESIISNLTFTQTIPRAAQHDETYLHIVANGIKDCRPPVDLDTDDVEGAGIQRANCLVVTPTARRLRYYRMLHFAIPMSQSLRMGYFLIGGDRAAGGSLLGGASFGIGIPTDADAGNVVSIMELIRDYAVAPAIQYIADLVQKDSQYEASGFFGT